MLNKREDLEAQVLEDKKAIELIYDSSEEEGVKKYKLSKVDIKDLDRSNCIHYVLDSKKILVIKDIHNCLEKTLDKDKFKISRVKKTHSKYIRLSVSLTVKSETRERALNALKTLLKLRVKKLKMKPNFNFSKKSKNNVTKMSILTLNTNNLKNKVEELEYHFRKEKPSIVCLQETCRPNINKGIFFTGYSVDEVPVSDTGLGLLIAIRKDLDLLPKIISKTENVIAVSVKNATMKMIVVNLYRPNSGPGRKQAMAEVIEIFNNYKDKNYEIIVVGDWNSTPEEVIRMLGKANVNAFANNVPTKGTRIKVNRKRTKRVIDFGISSKDGLIISQTRKRRWNISDHVPILVRIEQNQTIKSPERRQIFDKNLLSNRKKINQILNNDELRIENEVANIAVSNFNNFWQNKLKEVKIIREELIIRRSEQLPKRIRNLIKNMRITDKLVRKGIPPIGEYSMIRTAVKKAIQDLRRKRYLRFIKKGIDFLKNNDSRNSWKWIKKHCNIGRKSVVNSAVIDPITKDLINDPKQKLEVWANHFHSLCKKDPNERIFDCNYEPDTRYQEITDSPITWSEIISECTCTRNYKASGIDNIPSEFYKIVISDLEGNKVFSKNLILLLNKILNEGICPRDWEDCVIIPVFKKGDIHDPSNYRGIALINTLQKLFSKILARRIQVLNSEFNILIKEQAGFIKSEECVGQATCLLESLQRRKIRGKDTIVCFLDLKKAYDLVPHNRLIAKLKAKKIGPKIIKVLESMYSNTRMRVRIGENVSEAFRYERGVRQGCPTSPLLFNIYIDDLFDKVQPVEVEGIRGGLKGLLFADDTVILAESKNDLDQKLKVIEEWMKENSMEINPSKCGVMQINASDEVSPIEVLYKGEQIPLVEKYTYLGIEFNRHLDLQEMSEYRVRKGVVKLMTLSKTLRNSYVPMEYKKMLIGSIIAPTVQYGTELFGMSEKRCSSLKKVVDNGISMILKSKNFSRNRAYEELDLKPVQVRAAVSRARGYSKWSQSKGFIRDLIESSDQFKSKKHTWSKTTRIWLKRFRIDLTESITSGRNEVLSEYLPRIKSKDGTNASREATRLRLGSGKKIRRAEVNGLSPSGGLYYLTKIRTGTFQFTNKLVFSGQIGQEYTNKCAFCKNNCIENPEHLMLYCSAWREERQRYLGIRNNTSTSSVLLKSVLGGNSPASGRKPVDWIIASGNFLSAISRKRAALVAVLKRERL